MGKGTKPSYKSESDIQREICDYLASCNYFFWRSNNVPVFGRALSKYAARGLPDICILWRGVFIGLEVKRPLSDMREPNGRKVREGHLTKDQDEFGAKILFNDGQYHMVRSLSDCINVLHGVSIRYSFDLPKPPDAKLRNGTWNR